MPCWQTITNTVELKAADRSMLAETLEEMGFSVTRYGETLQAYNRGTTIRVSGESMDVEHRGNVDVEELTKEVKRNYSKKVVRKSAKRRGWKITEKSNGKLLATKKRW